MKPSSPAHPDRNRFFEPSGSFTLGELAPKAGFRPGIPGAENRIIRDICSLQAAGPEDATFLDNRQYLPLLRQTRAGACLVRPADAVHVPEGTVPLLTPAPYQSYARLVALLYPDVESGLWPEGIHPSAVIHPSAIVGEGCRIGPFAVVGAGALLGPDTWVGCHVFIGPGCILGENCRVGSHVSLLYTLAGDRVHIHPGARVGQSGFGFHIGPDAMTPVPHLGRVIVESDVRIGANTTIDRGSVGDTVIGRSSMIDNLVQIGHNGHLGERCVLAGQVGLAGSVHLEPGCVLGGQSGVKGHVRLGRGTQVAAKGGVTGDTPPGSILAGFPAQPIRLWQRWVALKKRWIHASKDPGRRSSPTSACADDSQEQNS